MYYVAEVPGAMVLVGDTHAAQGDSELAGTAMETSMTAKLRITLHKKADGLPKLVETLNFPLLETVDKYIVHGFAYGNYLDELEDPSDIFAEGASLDKAMEDCFLKTRDWLMDSFDLIEEETIALMTTSVDFGITQVVDGNWGVHADIPKWVFSPDDGPAFDYSCTTSMGPGRRHRRRGLLQSDRRALLEEAGVHVSPEEYADGLYDSVTKKCENCSSYASSPALADKLLDTKLHFIQKQKAQFEAQRALFGEQN
jgi:hypothetical protein